MIYSWIDRGTGEFFFQFEHTYFMHSIRVRNPYFSPYPSIRTDLHLAMVRGQRDSNATEVDRFHVCLCGTGKFVSTSFTHMPNSQTARCDCGACVECSDLFWKFIKN